MSSERFCLLSCLKQASFRIALLAFSGAMRRQGLGLGCCSRQRLIAGDLALMAMGVQHGLT